MLLPVLAAILVLTSGISYGADLTLSWVDNSFGSAATLIERRPGSDPRFQMLTVVAPRVAFYVDSTVVAGQTYCYRALAYINDSISPYTGEACGVAVDRLSVRVGKLGTGAGTVSSTPAGIACGESCSAVFPAGSAVVLSAAPSSGSTFVGWSGGGCTGTQPCAVAGNDVVAVTAKFSPAVRPPATGSVAGLAGVTITTSTVPTAYVDRAFSTTLVATGGRAPYSWSLVGGTLPSGLALDLARGTIAGRPTALSASAFTVRVRDALGATSERLLRLAVNGVPLTVTCQSAPAEVGLPYAAACTPRGGVAPYACDIRAGALPRGVRLNTDCTISGTPTVDGIASFTTRVRDSAGSTMTALSYLLVLPRVAIVTPVLPLAMTDGRFITALEASGGMLPYTWSVVGGPLPFGLELNPVDGRIVGIPQTAGITQLTVRVSDALGATFDQPYTLVVNYSYLR